MKKNGLRICESNEEWDNFCNESFNSTPFCQNWFIECVAEEIVRYFWFVDGEKVASILVPLENGVPYRPPFSLYYSLCFSKLINELPNQEKIKSQFQILDLIVKELINVYKQLSLSFHPAINDVRPLQWYNYNSSESQRFHIDVRYTAVRSLIELGDSDSLLVGTRKGRKSDYKKFLRSNINIENNVDTLSFLDLYKKTFERSGGEVDARILSRIDSILKSITPDRGFMLTAKLEDGTPISSIVILLGMRRAYYLFGANDSKYMNIGANTGLLINAMTIVKKLGYDEFDFVGANSPNRGDFKLSFNANLVTYFEAKIKI